MGEDAEVARGNASKLSSFHVFSAPDFESPQSGFGYLSQDIFGASASALNQSARQAPAAYAASLATTNQPPSSEPAGSTATPTVSFDNAQLSKKEKALKDKALKDKALKDTARKADIQTGSEKKGVPASVNLQHPSLRVIKGGPSAANVTDPFKTRDWSSMPTSSLVAKVADMNKHPAPAKRAEAWKEANQELKKVDRKFFWGVNGPLIENWAAIADPGGPGSCFLSYAAPANGSRSTSKANCPYGRLFEGTCKMKGCLNNYDHTNPAKMLPDPVRIKIFERTVAQVSSGPGSPPILDPRHY